MRNGTEWIALYEIDERSFQNPINHAHSRSSDAQKPSNVDEHEKHVHLFFFAWRISFIRLHLIWLMEAYMDKIKKRSSKKKEAKKKNHQTHTIAMLSFKRPYTQHLNASFIEQSIYGLGNKFHMWNGRTRKFGSAVRIE